MANNNPTALDFNDLIYYDKKIKKYVDDKADLIVSNSYSKEEVDAKLASITVNPDVIQELKSDIAVLKDDRDEAEADIEKIEAALVEIQDVIGNNVTQITTLTEEVNELESANVVITQRIADLQASIPSTEDLATKEEVAAIREQSARNEVKIMMIDSELVSINEALEAIPTKTSELENDSGFITSIPGEYITESELDSKGYITEHQSLENYATKEFVEESIDNINIPDVSNFATVEYVTNNYITTTQAESFATHEELETAVTEIVDEHFEETVIVHVDEEIEKKLAEVQTINYGTFGELE